MSLSMYKKNCIYIFTYAYLNIYICYISIYEYAPMILFLCCYFLVHVIILIIIILFIVHFLVLCVMFVCVIDSFPKILRKKNRIHEILEHTLLFRWMHLIIHKYKNVCLYVSVDSCLKLNHKQCYHMSWN